ncbi:hypothetical protein GCM10020331_044760 [Ectobacillus funiculus]
MNVQKKADYAAAYLEHLEDIYISVPGHFVWSIDHTKPDVSLHSALTKEALQIMLERLAKVKKRPNCLLEFIFQKKKLCS